MIKSLKQYRELKKARYIYREYYMKNQNVINELLEYYYTQNKKIAVWGGGLKGTAFLDLFDSTKKYICCVYDIDKNKWGFKTITGHLITSYEDRNYEDVEVVMIMNNNYETEIAGRLIEKDMHVILINIDSIIFGTMSTEGALKLYGKKL